MIFTVIIIHTLFRTHQPENEHNQNCILLITHTKQSNLLVIPPPPCQQHIDGSAIRFRSGAFRGQVDTLSSLSCSSVCSWAVIVFSLETKDTAKGTKYKNMGCHHTVFRVSAKSHRKSIGVKHHYPPADRQIGNAPVYGRHTYDIKLSPFQKHSHHNLGLKKRMTRSNTYTHTFCFISYLWISGVFFCPQEIFQLKQVVE